LNAHFGVKIGVKCATTLASEWVSMSRKESFKYSMPHHGIFPQNFHVVLIYDVAKYSTSYHGIF
jgi:hypothetical protein